MNKMAKKIILDTNALMAISEFKMDIFSELEHLDYLCEVSVLSGTVDELKKIIIEQRGKYKRAASLGLALLEAKKVKILKSSGDVDDALVKHSKKGSLVLTQDIGLKRRLRKPYLTIRQKRKVIVVK